MESHLLMLRHSLLSLSVIVLALLSGSPAAASEDAAENTAAENKTLEIQAVKAEFSSARLLLGKLHVPPAPDLEATDTVPPAAMPPAVRDAGVELTLEGAWKTYWRSPGDAGFPLTVTVEPTSANINAVNIRWPYPTRFVEEWGLEVFGFKESVVVPLEIVLNDAEAPAQADLRISYAVCSDICLSEEYRVSVEIPADYKPQAKDLKALAAARTRVPQENGGHGLTIASAVIESEDAASNKGVLLIEAESSAAAFLKPDVFVEGPVGIRFPKPARDVSDKGRKVAFRVPYEISLPAKTLDGAEVTLTLVAGGKSVETVYPVTRQVKLDEAALQGNREVEASSAKGFWGRVASGMRRLLPGGDS